MGLAPYILNVPEKGPQVLEDHWCGSISSCIEQQALSDKSIVLYLKSRPDSFNDATAYQVRSLTQLSVYQHLNGALCSCITAKSFRSMTGATKRCPSLSSTKKVSRCSEEEAHLQTSNLLHLNTPAYDSPFATAQDSSTVGCRFSLLARPSTRALKMTCGRCTEQ